MTRTGGRRLAALALTVSIGDCAAHQIIRMAGCQAKTGTMALSGFLDTRSGRRLAFSMIANNFTAPNAQVDAVMERALTDLAAAE